MTDCELDSFRSFPLFEMQKTIGEIRQKAFSFEWKILDFSSLPDKNGSNYESPTFECFDALWKFSVYANGISEEDIGWVSFILHKLQPRNSKHSVDLRINWKCDNIVIKTCHISSKFSATDARGWPKFIKRSDVLEKLRALSQNALSITSVISRSSVMDSEPEDNLLENVSTFSGPKPSLESLVRNLKALYLNQSNSDFAICVQDQTLDAHKGILGARSPIFAAMFAHDTVENLSGAMKIDDFEPDIVNDFLMYVYTGDVENLSQKSVSDLYAISEKYNVPDLKKECVDFMKCKLSLETVCAVLLLAEKYTEEKLLEAAKKFVAKCAAELLTSDHWKELEIENVQLALKVLKMIVLDNAWKIK